MERGELSAGHARALVPLTDEAAATALAQEIVKKGLSVRETERLVKTLLSGAPKREKRQKKRDVFFDEVELSVSQTLGRTAKVFLSSGGKGTLEIEFFGKDDLAKLVQLLEQ